MKVQLRKWSIVARCSSFVWHKMWVHNLLQAKSEGITDFVPFISKSNEKKRQDSHTAMSKRDLLKSLLVLCNHFPVIIVFSLSIH